MEQETTLARNEGLLRKNLKDGKDGAVGEYGDMHHRQKEQQNVKTLIDKEVVMFEGKRLSYLLLPCSRLKIWPCHRTVWGSLAQNHLVGKTEASDLSSLFSLPSSTL